MGEASRDFIRRLVGCQELSESEIHIALTAAGVDELVPDGNRKLSQLGLGATGFLLDFSCALMALSRDFTSKLKFRVNGIQHRADIAKRTGIDQHLRFDSRPGGRSSGVLALATSAIIGAIYLKTKSFESVARALYALGVLDENLDKLNLMEIFKDEQGDLLPMTSLIESEPPQTSEICFGSQDVTPLPEFVTPPDLGGVSNFESFYNESGELEQSFQNGVSITDLHSQSPSTGESNLAVEGRQMLDVDSRVHPEMHVGNFHDIGILPRPAEQHAIPPEFNVALMVCEELCQPHGSPGHTGPVERTSDFAIMAAPHNNLTGQPRTRGNPRNIEVATAVDKTMRDIFPDLERSSDIYRRKRRAVLDCRKFGQRLHILAECFGHAVLGLIHFDRSGEVASSMISEKIIIAPADEVFGNFVKILEDSQGDPLRMMSTAAKPAFEHILYEDMRQQNLFALERQIPGDILKLPKGSQELRNLLQ
ncbi:hypothetical protein AAEP93_003241 [Penicillium crustosum]